MAKRPDILETVQTLVAHPDFSIANPNRFRSLVGAFAAGNPYAFHRDDGAGYRFLVDQLMAVDKINPQLAARSFGPLSQWKRYEPRRRKAMRTAIDHLLARESVSKDVYEMASKALA